MPINYQPNSDGTCSRECEQNEGGVGWTFCNHNEVDRFISHSRPEICPLACRVLRDVAAAAEEWNEHREIDILADALGNALDAVPKTLLEE